MSSTYSPCSDDTVARVLDQPAGVLINVDMIHAIRAEETAILRYRESRNMLIDGDETIRTFTPPSLIREDHVGKKIKPDEAFRSIPGCIGPWRMHFHGTTHHLFCFKSFSTAVSRGTSVIARVPAPAQGSFSYSAFHRC